MISIECKTEEELEEIKKRFSDYNLYIKDQKKSFGTYFIQIDIDDKSSISLFIHITNNSVYDYLNKK